MHSGTPPYKPLESKDQTQTNYYVNWVNYK